MSAHTQTNGSDSARRPSPLTPEFSSFPPELTSLCWFCTSLQSTMKNNTRGKPKAVRLGANALKVKAIWADMDLGPNDPKKYPTVAVPLTSAKNRRPVNRDWKLSAVEPRKVTATVSSGGLVETVVPELAPLVRTGATFADNTHQQKCMDSVFKHSERLETPEQSKEL
jgi:hypothetical protein